MDAQALSQGKRICPKCGKPLIMQRYKKVSAKQHPWGLTIWESYPDHRSWIESAKCYMGDWKPDLSQPDWIPKANALFYFEEFEIPTQLYQSSLNP